MKIVTRAGWKARASKGVYTVPWSARTEFYVHHTDGPRTQSINSIQNFHMGPDRGWSDIGYNYLVDQDGVIYEGRGWLGVGAHCPDHNRTGIGVAFIGDNNPTPAAQRAIRWLYDEACRRAGRTLAKRCHGDSYPTECPGDRLRAWVRAGMPVDTAAADISWTEELVKDLPMLAQGADNFDVKTIRAALFARGGLAADSHNGAAGLQGWLERTVFDAGLTADVKAFQKAKSLSVDGIVGPKTWAALLRR